MSVYVIKPKVISLHETGYVERDYVTNNLLNYIVCGDHFVKYPSPLKRNVVTTSIKTIENFEVPILRFHKCRIRKLWFFCHEKFGYKKIDTARGCMLTFLDGSRMFVKESESEIKNMIEENVQ